MAIGVVLPQTVPGINEAIDSWQLRGISIPIGICLFLMMCPALLNLQLSELKKLRDNPKPIIMTLFSNRIVAPLVAVLVANLFLQGKEQLIVAVILLGASPCTAMVLVWGKLAEANQEQNHNGPVLGSAHHAHPGLPGQSSGEEGLLVPTMLTFATNVLR
jgi:ACR3 family arsenite transporter